MLAPFLRVDSEDADRSLVDVRQALWRHRGTGFDLSVGVGRVFWGATESVHLVDIVNQTDLAADFDGEQKLGQPMLALSTAVASGTLEIFVLPGARPRTFAGKNGRPRFGLPIDADPHYHAGAGRLAVAYALRLQQTLASTDVGISLFHGTTREPTLTVAASGDRLIAGYAPITQLGIDLQHARGNWLLKAEGIVRSGHAHTFGAGVVGFEYTLALPFAPRLDTALLAEYAHDGRDANPARAPYTVADDDVFAGLRVGLNDLADSQAQIGALVDRETGGTAIALDAQRRLGAEWTLVLSGQWFVNIDASDPLSTFRDDDHVTLRLERHF